MDKLNMSRTMAEQTAEVNATTRRPRDLFLDLSTEEWSNFPMINAFEQFVPAQEAYRYLLKRGITVATAKECGIRYDFDLCRVLFPWRLNGKLVGFTGRATDPAERVKTLPYADTKKGDHMYVPSPKFSPKDQKLVLVEGEIDSIKVMQDCTRQVAATGFGKFTPEQQALVLSWSPSEVVTFFDDDLTGQALYKIVRKTIGQKIRVSYADYEPYREKEDYTFQAKLDPASLTPEDRREILSKNRNELSI